MYRTESRCRKAKSSQMRKKFMSSVKGASHLSRRAKRRLYCKFQLWLWRKRSEKRRLWIFRSRRRTSGINSGSGSHLSLKPQSQKDNVSTIHLQTVSEGTTAPVPPAGQDGGGSEGAVVQQNGLSGWRESDSLSESPADPGSMQVTDTNFPSCSASQTTQRAMASSQSAGPSVQLREMDDPLNPPHVVRSVPCAGSNACNEQLKVQREQRLPADCPSRQHSSVSSYQNQTTKCVDDRISSDAAPPTNVCLEEPATNIHDYLDGFYRRYGSFIPLCNSDLLRHLKKFNSDFSDRYRAAIMETPIPSFQVVYKKHRLTLEDLLTLADQSWLNDQIMNMYGELIMESSHHKVHFLNSFFHRQLMTKGYDGVKRWTKQVDLFSKRLLLVPVHLEVHWCLVTADIATKKICLYDSQGNALQKVARNILKYLMTEAKEKKQTAFESGWTISCDEKVPQQTNENDCGVFVLEYSRCLALSRPFQFSQKDIPKIRKRIYKELCDCKIYEQE
ncbi:sentrin-specific protease 5 isoform X2 [Nematolebias whitei]|uniref:sentrin-specific protease 5 isoform X2 n=1 Tax=Nematolebias whitei TaxID=451745 RepID=UPI00189C51F9|nr:sentrin-specific protease 5 isoform X2 [Nematolebias whitei]